MRLNIRHLLFLLLLLFTLAVAHFQLGIFSTLLGLSLLALADLTVRSWYPGNEQLVLETFPASIYSEKARWVMDYANIQYEEEPDIGIFGRLLTGRFVPTLWVRGRQVKVANTSDIFRYLLGVYFSEPEVRTFLLPSSQSEHLERRLDEYASYFRNFVYCDLLDNNSLQTSTERKEIIARSWGARHPDIPLWQRLIARYFLPILIMAVSHELEVNKGAQNLKKANEIMEEFETMLSDGRQFLLKTDKPTYIDITLAALAGYHAYPENLFGNKAMNPESRIDLKEMGPNYEKEVIRFRGTKVGQFVLRMYRDYRNKQINCSSSDHS